MKHLTDKDLSVVSGGHVVASLNSDGVTPNITAAEHLLVAANKNDHGLEAVLTSFFPISYEIVTPNTPPTA